MYTLSYLATDNFHSIINNKELMLKLLDMLLYDCDEIIIEILKIFFSAYKSTLEDVYILINFDII